MPNDPRTEILAASALAVKAAKKELNRNLDYSVNSLKDLESLLQHVKSHFSDMKKEGKLTEQIVQRASISIGGYLGEVIRRRYGGTWIAKNDIMKTLVIDGQEISPILYVFNRLTKEAGYGLDKYLYDINQKLQHPEVFENKPLVSETPKKAVRSLGENTGLFTGGGIVGIVVLCIVGILSLAIYSIFARIPPAITPHPTATRIRATSTPSLITREPINYLQNLPSGYVVSDSIEPRDKTLNDGTRLFDIALTNRQAFNHGDLVSVQYFITIYTSESKATSEYYKYLLGLKEEENGVLDSEIEIEGTDASAAYMAPLNGDNIVAVQYTSRVKNIMVTTVGLSTYAPEAVTDSFLKAVMTELAELHRLAIDNTH